MGQRLLNVGQETMLVTDNEIFTNTKEGSTCICSMCIMYGVSHGRFTELSHYWVIGLFKTVSLK